MIIYRPHRGSLSDAMKECRTFNNEQEMKEAIVKDLRTWPYAGYRDATTEDIHIANDGIDDPRIGWKNSKYVLFIKDDTHCCVGMCSDDFLRCTCEEGDVLHER